MSNKEDNNSNNLITVKAININTNEVMFEGCDGEDVLKKAVESGKDFILDFDTNSEYNFVF